MVELLSLQNCPQSHQITVLDCWETFYQDYVVSKTCPSAQKIANRNHIAAAKPSVRQDMLNKLKEERSRGGGATDDAHLLRRFIEDDVLRSTMAYLCFKTRMGNDPVMCSFLRDLERRAHRLRSRPGDLQQYSQGLRQRINKEEPPTDSPSRGVGNSGSPPTPLRDSTGEMADALWALTERQDTTTKWLKLNMVDAAMSIVDNALEVWKRGCRGKNVQGKGMVATEQQKFEAVLALFDTFASSGSAQSLLGISAPLEEFVGPMGFLGSMPTTGQVLWRTLKVPVVIVLSTMILLVILSRYGS
jgi:hypothetical protein